MVCAEDSHKPGSVSLNQVQVLINRVSGALVPILAHTHLSRNRRDKVISEKISGSPALVQMLQQRLRFELGQNIDRKDTGVHEVGEDKIDNSIPASERHGGLRSVCRQGVETLAPAAGEDNSQDIHHCTSILLPPQRKSCSYRLLYA